MNDATTEQPLPISVDESGVSIHEVLIFKYMDIRSITPVIEDIVKRAEKAQKKYKLERPGLYAFNGRDALLDAYQELCDLIIYMLQFTYEEEVRAYEGTIREPRVATGYVLHLLSEAATFRENLVEQGDFE